jgi:hypothetical protein
LTVFYGSSVANGTISTANTMSTTTGGTETSKTSVYSGGNHFGEVLSQGAASGTPVTAIPATPTGKGWVTAAPGAGTFALGNWNASIALALSSSATPSFTVRFFKYSSGTYTSIGTIATSAASLGTSRTVISFAATSVASVTFVAGDLLYADLWMQDTTGVGGDNPIVYESNSATAGVANDVQITTSTFTPAGGTDNKSAPMLLRLASALKTASAPMLMRLASAAQRKSAPMLFNLGLPGRIVSAPLLLRLRSAPKTISAPALLRLASATQRKSAPLLFRVASLRTRSVGMLLRLVASHTVSAPMLFNLARPPQTVSVPMLLNLLNLNKNAYTAVIGNRPVMIVAGTLSIVGTIGKRSQSSFTIYNADTNFHVQQWQAVSIWDQFGNLAFTGYVTSPKETKPGFQASLVTQITCTDQHYLADKRLIAKIYAGRTRASIVQNILLTILSQEGVTLGAIVPEDANVATLYPSTTLYPNTTLYPQGNAAGLVNATFIYASIAQALDALTKDANQSGIPYYWMIDKFKKLYWVPYTYSINPNVVDGTTIDQMYTPSNLTRANPLYRNYQYIVGGVEQTARQDEIRAGDGSTRSWTMGYALASAPVISTNLASGGYVAQSVGIKGIDSNKAFYWQQGDTTITQDSSQVVLGVTDLLQVVYTGQYPITTSASSDAQISTQASIDLTSGIVEEVEVDASLTTAADGLSKATGLITRNAVQGMLFEYTTLDSSYTPGEMRTYNYDPHGLNNVQMIVEKITATDQVDGVNIWYTIDAVYGPYDQTWQDFFKTLIGAQQANQAISAGVQGIISTTQKFSAALSLAASMTITIGTAVTLYGSNALSSLLTTASQMSATIGGSETSATTHINGGGHYGEVTSRGLTVSAVSSIPTTPTGNGWAYKPGASTSPAGNWSAIDTVSFADWQSGNTLTIRFFKVSSGVYTSIGTITTTLTGRAKAIYRYAATLLGSVTFGTNDLLYVDRWLFDSSGAGGDDPTLFVSSNGAAGVTNDAQIITPGL